MFKELIKQNKILVIGDFMLDSYWLGNVSRISPEAPVAVFQKQAYRAVAGGAANVAANLMAAGKTVIAAAVIGNDKAGEELKALLNDMGCDCSLVQSVPERRTTAKTRILAQNNQQLLRIDEEDIKWLTEAEEEKVLNGIKQIISSVSAVVLSDYMKGMLTKTLCQKTINLAKEKDIPVFCDVKDTDTEKYVDATLIKPNKKELELLSGMPTRTKDEIMMACEKLCNWCRNKYLLVTLGAQGMALYERKSNSIEFISSEPKEVFDVSGAGDTVISYLVACVSSGIDIHDSVRYANKAAGIKVGKVGTATVSLDEVEQDMRRDVILKQTCGTQETKIYTLSELLKKLHDQPDKRVVFTNGCFDILHSGHVMYLQKAAEYGDILVVGVNSDNSIRRLKGPSRPVNSEEDRLAVLSGLQSVDCLIVFDDDTPEELIQSIGPDVLVKGSDYEGKYIAGADYVKKKGGQVVLIPMLEGRSTTKIIQRSKGRLDG